MTSESYDFCTLWLMKFMKNVVYDFGNYEKHIYDKHIVIFFTTSFLNYENFVRSYEHCSRYRKSERHD